MAETSDHPPRDESWWERVQEIARKESQQYYAKSLNFGLQEDHGVLQQNWYPSYHAYTPESVTYTVPSVQAGVQAGPKGLTPRERTCAFIGHVWEDYQPDNAYVVTHRCRRCGVLRQQHVSTNSPSYSNATSTLSIKEARKLMEMITEVPDPAAFDPDAIPPGMDLCIWCGHQFLVEEIEAHEDVCSS